MATAVTVRDVQRVAELANLELGQDETAAMLHDLNAILEYVARLNELDTRDVAPLAQVSELEGARSPGALRQDRPEPSLDRPVVLEEAPEADRAFFKVPKVIER
jgi:aspartyl-tRNA(Asn)/glutamyl-tRNA(Gln) amidotransferase subunit C